MTILYLKQTVILKISIYYTALFSSIFLTAVSHLLLKISHKSSYVILIILARIVALSLFFVCTLLTTFALVNVEVKIVSSLSSLSYLLTFIFSIKFLDEVLSPKK